MTDAASPAGRVRKRSTNACTRCRQQKIRCSGAAPCQSCMKRGLACSFNDANKKVLITAGYLQSLERRFNSQPQLAQDVRDHVQEEQESSPPQEQHLMPFTVGESGPSTPGADLVNPLALDSDNYMPDGAGRQIHLGTSSNWSFARRVLTTVCKRLDLQIPARELYFEGCAYELDWAAISPSAPAASPRITLPSADHAVYLLNTLKFHCCQQWHLFDEDSFMQSFASFYDADCALESVPRSWYGHFLLLLAIAKLILSKRGHDRTPPGSEFFVVAMKNLPDLMFSTSKTLQSVEALTCAALYLQCLDFRNAAFNIMGIALRRALEQGLHTQISPRTSESSLVQRCRHIWWTVYILDRQMSALMGLPQAIRDDDTSAPLPLMSGDSKSVGFELHVRLSRLTAEIANTVYSTEGRIPRRFLASTKRALQKIAEVTELLGRHFAMPRNGRGSSRFGAYLHLLNHQCICLTTRPLAYTFLDRSLQHQNEAHEALLPRGSARVLLRMCVDSAQQMINILVSLKDEGLLESFLPFDLDAIFIAAIVLTMVRAIDSGIIDDSRLWLRRINDILDDMASSGNVVAILRQRELQQLESCLVTIAPHSDTVRDEPNLPGQAGDVDDSNTAPQAAYDGLAEQGEDQNFQYAFWHDGMTAGQLLGIADSLDLDGFDWMTASLDGAST